MNNIQLVQQWLKLTAPGETAVVTTLSCCYRFAQQGPCANGIPPINTRLYTGGHMIHAAKGIHPVHLSTLHFILKYKSILFLVVCAMH